MIDVLRPLLCTWYAKWAEQSPKVMKRSQRWNILQICPRRNSNTVGSDLWSNTLPLDHGGASDIVKDRDLDMLLITQTWLTGNVSDQKLLGDVTAAGCLFHHATRFTKRGKFETHLHFQVKSFEYYHPTFVPVGIDVDVVIIYRLHTTK